MAQVIVWTGPYEDETTIYLEDGNEDVVEINANKYEGEYINREELNRIKAQIDRIRIPKALKIIREWWENERDMLEEEEESEREMAAARQAEEERIRLIKQDPAISGAIELLKARGINVE